MSANDSTEALLHAFERWREQPFANMCRENGITDVTLMAAFSAGYAAAMERASLMVNDDLELA